MGYTMGPVRLQAQGVPVGMAPEGFMMGGGRQGIGPRTSVRNKWLYPPTAEGDKAYEKALKQDEAEQEAFFGGIDQERQAMMPFWMR
jgi:hypothetical protein